MKEGEKTNVSVVPKTRADVVECGGDFWISKKDGLSSCFLNSRGNYQNTDAE